MVRKKSVDCTAREVSEETSTDTQNKDMIVILNMRKSVSVTTAQILCTIYGIHEYDSFSEQII